MLSEVAIAGAGIALLLMSRGQPFPEISRGFGLTILVIGAVFLLSRGAGRPFTEEVGATMAIILGGIGVTVGIRHLARTHRDVLVAPIASILLASGTILLLAALWDRDAPLFDHLSGFALAVFVSGLSLYLVFRGLLIGGLQRGWSQAGLRQLHRGLIDGPNGAVSCFERAWDPLDESLDAMSHAALVKIHRHMKREDKAEEHQHLLDSFGGWDAIDETWIEVIDEHLGRFSSP